MQNSHNFEISRNLNPTTKRTTDVLQTAPIEWLSTPDYDAEDHKRKKKSKHPMANYQFKADDDLPDPKIRRNFPETFLWIEVEIGQAS